MLSLEQQLDIINSDTRLLDATKRVGKQLSLSGDYFPDGRELVANVDGDINFNVLSSWCGQCRGEWNARKASQEAAAHQQAAAHRANREQEAERANGRSNSPVPVEDDNEVGEASLEATLRSQESRLGARRERWANRVHTLRCELVEAEHALAEIDRDIVLVMRMLKEFEDDDSSEDSPQDSLDILPDSELGTERISESDPLV